MVFGEERKRSPPSTADPLAAGRRGRRCGRLFRNQGGTWNGLRALATLVAVEWVGAVFGHDHGVASWPRARARSDPALPRSSAGRSWVVRGRSAGWPDRGPRVSLASPRGSTMGASNCDGPRGRVRVQDHAAIVGAGWLALVMGVGRMLPSGGGAAPIARGERGLSGLARRVPTEQAQARRVFPDWVAAASAREKAAAARACQYADEEQPAVGCRRLSTTRKHRPCAHRRTPRPEIVETRRRRSGSGAEAKARNASREPRRRAPRRDRARAVFSRLAAGRGDLGCRPKARAYWSTPPDAIVL